MFLRANARYLALLCLFLIIFFSRFEGVATTVTAADYIAAGDKAFSQGRAEYLNAIKQYTAALDVVSDEQRFKVHYKRAEVYQAMKQYSEALADLDAWVKLKPNKSALTSRIKVNLILANFGAASEDYLQLVNVDPKKATDHHAKGAELRQLGLQLQHLRAKLAQLAEGPPGDAEGRRAVHQQCMAVVPAMQEYAKTNVDLMLLKAECALGLSDHTAVRAELNRILERQPNSPKALALKAQSLYMMGGLDAARSHIRMCLTVDQEFADCVALHKKIKAYEKHRKASEEAVGDRRWAEALAAVDAAFAVDPEGPETSPLLRRRCEVLYHLRRVPEGLAACTACIEGGGDTNELFDVHLVRADIHLLNDDLNAAAKDIAKARELKPNDRRVHEKEQNLARLRKMADRKDYYKILGVPKTATEKDIKAAYRKLSFQWHPDKTQNLSEEERDRAQALFRDIVEAKEVLCDDEKRGKYDRGEDLQPQQQGARPQGFPGGMRFHFNFG